MKSLDLWPRVFWSACALLSYRKMDRLIVSTIASTYQQRDHFDRDSLHAVLYPALLQAAVQAVNRVPRGELRGNRRQTVNKQWRHQPQHTEMRSVRVSACEQPSRGTKRGGIMLPGSQAAILPFTPRPHQVSERAAANQTETMRPKNVLNESK